LTFTGFQEEKKWKKGRKRVRQKESRGGIIRQYFRPDLRAVKIIGREKIQL